MLPYRPLLLDQSALRWQTASTVLVGRAPDHVVVAGVDEPCVAWMRGLDGTRTLDEALAMAPSREVGLILLRALVDGHCRDDAALAPGVARRRSVAARDVLARRRPEVITLYGAAAHALLALDRRATIPVHVLGNPQIAERIVGALRTIGHYVVAGDPDERAGLIVWCTSDDPDAIAEHGWTHTHAHLSVAVTGRVASIGPLVVPGRTPCLRCAFLGRVDRDEHWPRIASQITHAPAHRVDDALVALVTAWSVVHIRSAIDVGLTALRSTDALPPLALLGQRIDMRLPEGDIHARRIDVHPSCGCNWSQTVRPAA